MNNSSFIRVKIKCLLLSTVLLCSFCLNALGQLKVFSDGSVAVNNVLSAEKLLITNDESIQYTIQQLSSSLISSLLQLDVNKYTPVDELSNNVFYGLSAQQVYNILPELVETTPDGNLSVRYSDLVALLLKAVQYLAAQINDQGGTTLYSAVSAANNNSLLQNSPNPFKESTVIHYNLPDDVRDASIIIFDLQGKISRRIPLDCSDSHVTINRNDLAPGIYLYSLMADGREFACKRMIISQ